MVARLKFFFLLFLNLCSLSFVKAQTELWGTVAIGGEHNTGTIFKTDGNGDNINIESSFSPRFGSSPVGKIIETSGGKFYGLTSGGGINSHGVLFEYDPVNNLFITKYNFEYDSVGGFPQGDLVEAPNGNLYGVIQGGPIGYGSIFEYDPVGDVYSTKFEFDGLNSGKYPHSPVLASNGRLYGMTLEGGSHNRGVLFEYDLSSDLYLKILDFDLINGGIPRGGLLEATNGKLYGMTQAGGAHSNGVMFEYDFNSHVYAILIDFMSTSSGSSPHGELMQASNGKLYGMTTYGGANNKGVIFEYDYLTSLFTKKFDFDGLITGGKPFGSLEEGANGILYGMTTYGGVNDVGVLFKYDLFTDVFEKKLDFTGENGEYPYGGLKMASNGMLYGMTNEGGYSSGVLFEYNPLTNSFIVKLDLKGNTTGLSSGHKLSLGPNGKFYGIAEWGGSNAKGTLFEFDPAGNMMTKKLDFNGGILGSNPEGSLELATNGKFYGTTRSGGINNLGTVFEYDPIGDVFSKKADFNGTNNGSYPRSSLIIASNGKFYGVSSQGGLYNNGVLFEYDPIGETLSKKFDFDGSYSGSNPYGGLMEASNGKLYGTSNAGGVNNKGVLFEYDPIGNTFSKKIDFDGINNGSSPQSQLVEASNGRLYGFTHYGGTDYDGVLFEFDLLSNIIIVKHNFDNVNFNGINPSGSLLEASNGKLYGMTSYGGFNNKGVLFEFDYSSNSYVKKVDFNDSIGTPYFKGGLIEYCPPNQSSFSVTECNSYTLPSGDSTYTAVGTHNITDTVPFCGKMMNITITILPPKLGFVSGDLCHGDSIIVNGTTYNSSNLTGIETFTNIGPYGCDSTVTINLTALPPKVGSVSSSICDYESIVINGTSYNSNNLSGVEIFTNVSSTGCDSTVTINLTSYPPLESIVNPHICNNENVVINGTVYDANNISGIEVFPNVGPNGCDSIVTVNLVVTNIDTTVNQTGGVNLTSNESGGTFQWIDCDNNSAISGATSQTYTATVNGNYAVIVHDGNCTDTSACLPVYSVGISQATNTLGVSIYPNPAKDNFTITTSSWGNTSVEIYNAVGEIVFTQQLNNSITVVNTNDLSKGVYVVSINNIDTKQTHCLVIQ